MTTGCDNYTPIQTVTHTTTRQPHARAGATVGSPGGDVGDPARTGPANPTEGTVDLGAHDQGYLVVGGTSGTGSAADQCSARILVARASAMATVVRCVLALGRSGMTDASHTRRRS